MCNFNELSDAEKTAYHLQLIKCADSFGGMNFFLQLLEAIRKNKPHPLQAKHMEFKFSRGIIKWNKIIFKDKLSLLMKIRVNENEDNNLLPSEDDASYKKVMNLLRTLRPLEFYVSPKNDKDGEGFMVRPFDVINDNTTRLNPIFDALFFCSVETTKKALNYTPKAS